MMFTPTQLLRDSLRHHRRIHAAVALGVAVTTAVLVGALVVGDSVRGSLKHTALDRLADIEDVLVTDKFFRVDLAEQIPDTSFPRDASVVLVGTVTNPSSRTRATQITLIGSDRNAARLHTGSERQADDEIYLNQPLAEELGVREGDEVIVRLPAPREVPAESALGRKTDSVSSTPRLKVKRIVPTTGFGAFSLRPNQSTPKNAYLSLSTLQDVLDKPGRANALFVGSHRPTEDRTKLAADEESLARILRPTLVDYGLKWTLAKSGYFSLTSERMLFEPSYEAAALAAYKALQPQPVLTYLANTIAADNGEQQREIPYSTIAALDLVNEPTLGPFVTPDGKKIEKISDDEIVLNKWAADDLKVAPGATITIKYFEPESTHADVHEATATFKLAAVVDLKPNDPLLSPDLTPELPGVTDQLSIRPKRRSDGKRSEGWNPPFPYDADRVRDADEEYWDQYRATPKAFVSAATGRRLWSSRFGEMTSLRVAPRDGLTVEKLNAMFQPDPAALGFAFQPVKLRALEASTGTTPFEGLFLGFSMFIIAAAVMLTVLLFKLGVEQRAAEAGLMLAVGLGERKVARLFLGEGAIVAAVGAAVGTALGVGYAWLMLYLLRTWWFDAVRTSALDLYARPMTLASGYAIGVLVSVGAIAWSLRALRRVSVRRLLANQAQESDLFILAPGESPGASGNANRKTTVLRREAHLAPGGSPGAKTSVFVAMACLVFAAGLGFFALRLSDMAQAGAFMGCGALLLTALILLLRRSLAAARFGSLVTQGPGRIATLAVRNAGRNPGRSTLTISLVAAAAFLIVAVSAFRLGPPGTYLKKSSGTGGFALLARSDLPILPDLNTDDGQIDLNFSQAQRKQLKAIHTYPLRYRPGDDSSCLNLYQTTKPQVLGVTEALIERGGFDWAAAAAETDAERANPWLLLRPSPRWGEGGSHRETDEGRRAEGIAPSPPAPLPDVARGELMPIVLDQATAQYGLKTGGVGSSYLLDVGDGREPIRCRIVGLLRNSILQGSVITSEAYFKRHFPDASGYRQFLLEAGPEQVVPTQRMLEDVLADFGFDAEPTRSILADYMAVQNTYLSTFQTLGGLGLLLGTVGLAVVQLRSVLERRGELALLRAVGLSSSLLARLVFCENLALLLGGLGCGAIAALAAVLPHALVGGAGVPYAWLGGTLGAVLFAGLVTAALTVRAVLRMPLLASLRGE
jgi:putative ABC transport system permease protein